MDVVSDANHPSPDFTASPEGLRTTQGLPKPLEQVERLGNLSVAQLHQAMLEGFHQIQVTMAANARQTTQRLDERFAALENRINDQFNQFDDHFKSLQGELEAFKGQINMLWSLIMGLTRSLDKRTKDLRFCLGVDPVITCSLPFRSA